MTIEARYKLFGDFRTAPYSKLYWLDIDVMLQDLYYRRHADPNQIVVRSQPLSLEYCVLQGVGAVANALTVGPQGLDFDRFIVDIAGQFEVERNWSRFEQRSSAKMIWNNLDDRWPRLDIYIPNHLSRHLVELYVTRRIDSVQLSMQIAVIGEDMGKLEGLPDGFPLLRQSDQLYFRRTQCELLSVYTALGKH